MPNKRSYKELVLIQETHQTYTLNHLKNIDSHLDALNTKTAQVAQKAAQHDIHIKALWKVVWGLFAMLLILLGSLITVQIVL